MTYAPSPFFTVRNDSRKARFTSTPPKAPMARSQPDLGLDDPEPRFPLRWFLYNLHRCYIGALGAPM